MNPTLKNVLVVCLFLSIFFLTMGDLNNLEEEALKRKERLKLLKRKREEQKSDNESSVEAKLPA